MSSNDTGARFWREEIDSLAFRPNGHAGWCVVHRLAFRALLGYAATPQACCDYFENRQSIFASAASTKIARTGIAPENNFHLNSRDIRRTLSLKISGSAIF
jgi:hypothetical protein